MKTDDGSGWLKVVDDQISYHSRDYGSWEIPISELRVIGEMTNEDGPFGDDWFLVFVTDDLTQWYEGSAYAAGVNECLLELEKHLGTISRGDLVQSTRLFSRISWPADLVGEELFAFRKAGVFRRSRDLRVEFLKKELGFL